MKRKSAKRGKKIANKRESYEGYICETCDTDFGINEHGCLLEPGIHSIKCPVCGEATLRAYLVVKEMEVEEDDTR